jgi:hypothetical protein
MNLLKKVSFWSGVLLVVYTIFGLFYQMEYSGAFVYDPIWTYVNNLSVLVYYYGVDFVVGVVLVVASLKSESRSWPSEI